MYIGGHDLGDRSLIVAEIGNNHEGDMGVARELIAAAAASGADAVKFQVFRPDGLVGPGDVARRAVLERFMLPREEIPALAAHAAAHGVQFMATPFDLDAVAVLEPHVPAYKIASGDNDYAPLITAAAETGKPLIVSTGLTDEAAVVEIVETVRSARSGGPLDLVLLHCACAYPVPDADVNLRAIASLARHDCPVGWSDHTLGMTAALGSIALGACVIEKHFTLAHDYSDYRDHALSATPSELSALVQEVRRLEAMLGDGIKRVMPSEADGAATARRSAVAARDLPAGHPVAAADVAFLRPGDGMTCRDVDGLIGFILEAPLAEGTPFPPPVSV